MSIVQMAGAPIRTSDAAFLLGAHPEQVPTRDRKLRVNPRPSVFGVQWSLQLTLLVVASVSLALLVAIAVFEWIGRT
ncbi:MAG: hypothetical protein JWM02_2 [Frankiales bacterium]|nr:hypothetical protein [Frankiales bacterium]